jgi:hypothetical protein
MAVGSRAHVGTNKRVGVYVETRVFNKDEKFARHLFNGYYEANNLMFSQTNDESRNRDEI